MALSDLADWWDTQKRESERTLMRWVEENPQWWAIALAGTTQTAMDLGTSWVDALRFGEGAAQGGWRGYGKDALRLLVLLGPLARGGAAASRFLTPLLRSSQVAVAVQVTGVDGPCTFQAAANAVRIMKGKNIFLTVGEMAKGAGVKLSSLVKNSAGEYELAAWIDELVPFLKSAGYRVRAVTGLKQLREVFAVIKGESAPVVFAIRATVRNAAGELELIEHSVIGYRSALGALRFADYGGKFVNSLEELLAQFGKLTGPIELMQAQTSATIIEGARLTGQWARQLSNGALLVLEGLAAIETPNGVQAAVPLAHVASTAPFLDDPADVEVVKGSYDAFKARAQGKPIIRLPPVYITAGQRGAPHAERIAGVQFRLNAIGFGAGPVDGIIGHRTRHAVRHFQHVYHVAPVDGVPGPATRARLSAVCGY